MQITLVCCSIRESPGVVCSVTEMSLSSPAFINKHSYFNTTVVKFTAAKTALSGRGEPASPAVTLPGCRVLVLMLVPPRKRAVLFSNLPPDFAVPLHSKCCREAHSSGVGQKDFLCQEEATFAHCCIAGLLCPLPPWVEGARNQCLPWPWKWVPLLAIQVAVWEARAHRGEKAKSPAGPVSRV